MKTIEEVREFILKLTREMPEQKFNPFISDEVYSTRHETLKEILAFIESEEK
jgi:hypothetical protein